MMGDASDILVLDESAASPPSSWGQAARQAAVEAEANAVDLPAQDIASHVTSVIRRGGC